MKAKKTKQPAFTCVCDSPNHSGAVGYSSGTKDALHWRRPFQSTTNQDGVRDKRSIRWTRVLRSQKSTEDPKYDKIAGRNT